jgi:hypothetical protein
MVTLAGLEPATSPAPVNKDALSPLSYSVVTIFMTVWRHMGAWGVEHMPPRRVSPPWSSKRPLARSQKSLLLTTCHCVALGKLPVCPEKLQIVMAVTEALSQFLATANAFMEERKSEGP